MLTTTLEIASTDFESTTGWAIKPEGACRGEVCVPLPPEARLEAGKVRLDVVAHRLGAPLVHDEGRGLYAVGPSTLGGRALPSARAPRLELPTIDGARFDLSALHGMKTVLVAWASW